MKKDQKQQLIALGADTLAEALLSLATRSESADAMIERLIATPDETQAGFKRKLASLKRSRRFFDWSEIGHFVEQLGQLLDDLQACVSDPLMGVEMVVAFLETDSGVFNRCDDSSGYVGNVFSRAQAMFVDYASKCEDKKKISAILLKLNKLDDFGIRGDLVSFAEVCGLSEALMRSMIAEFQKRADKAQDDYQKRHHLMLIESLAKQLKDAELFEATRIASWGKLSTAAYIDIARIYFEQGNIQTAQARLNQISENETFMTDDRDKLWLEIYQQQGDTEKLSQLLTQRFQRYRTVSSLQALLEVIGEDKRDGVISKEVALIAEQASLKTSDAEFLIAIDKINEAESYLLNHVNEFNGDHYGSLLSLVKAMEAENRYLVVSLMYRSLLDSILARARSKIYSHGVRYLNKLDTMAISINDWHTFDSHADYKALLYQAHGRKKSFWSKYE